VARLAWSTTHVLTVANERGFTVHNVVSWEEVVSMYVELAVSISTF